MEDWELKNILDKALDDASTRTVNQIKYNNYQNTRPVSGSGPMSFTTMLIIGAIVFVVGNIIMFKQLIFTFIAAFIEEFII